MRATILLLLTLAFAGCAHTHAPEQSAPAPLLEGNATDNDGKVCREIEPLREFGKQAWQQPGHFLMVAGPGLVSTFLTGTPLPGILLVAPFLIAKEVHQWPSCRAWDPPLDWFFYLTGLAVFAL